MRHKDQISIAFWTSNCNYRALRDLFYQLKKSVELPRYHDFDFCQHPTNYKKGEYKKKEDV